MYLQKADYRSRISTELLNIVIAQTESETTGTADDILTTADKIATDTIATMAGVLYDTTGEWPKTGAARNYRLLSWALSIAVYEIYQRIDDEQIPEKAIKNYNDTMNDLDKVANGKMPLDLPARVDDTAPDGTDADGNVITDGNGLRRMGSRAKRSHYI